MLCSYGCNQPGKYTLKNGKLCCSKSINSCAENRKRNSVGQKKCYTEGRRHSYLTDEHRQKSIDARRDSSLENAFREKSSASNGFVKKVLLEQIGVEEKCQNCGISEWQGVKIPLELDHINGVSNDHRINNIRLLCPNCHSITPTWRGRNINSGFRKVTDEELLTALDECSNIRQALLKVGLAAKGGNYNRAKKLLKM